MSRFRRPRRRPRPSSRTSESPPFGNTLYVETGAVYARRPFCISPNNLNEYPTGRSSGSHYAESLAEGARTVLSDLAALTKFRLSATVVLSAVLAYLIAAPLVDWNHLAAVFFGGFATTMAANVLNQVIERDHDQLMTRTADRPLATGRMSVSRAVLIAGLLSVAGMLALSTLNPSSALLGMIALLSYAFIYTPLKRISVAAVFVGTIPGAIPALIGAVAAEGEITSLGWSLFLIQVLWQIPHFWAIGWLGFDDYKRAGFKLMPETSAGERDPGTGLQSAAYGLLLSGLVWWPFAIGAFSVLAAAISMACGLGYAWFGLQLFRRRDRTAALRLMFYSLAYLPVVFALGWLL